MAVARDRGLTHVAITDHDTITGALRARDERVEGITVIVGQEVRTTEGDLILLFVDQPIASGMTPEQTVARAKEQGALVGLAHPFDVNRPSIGRGAVRPAELERLASLVDYIEVYNARVADQMANARAADFAREYGVAQVAVSDCHTEPEIGLSATVFKMPIETADDLRKALAAGGTLSVHTPPDGDDDRGGLRRLRSLFRAY